MSDLQGTADPAGAPAPAPARRVRSLAGVAAVALLVAVVGGAVGVHQLGARGGGAASAGGGPSPRLGAAIAYDPASGQTVLFGGQGPDGRALGDTWTWDGASWTLQHPRHSPSARTGAAMAADRSQHEVVLFGGTRAPSGAVTCGVNGGGAATGGGVSVAPGGGASAVPMPPVPPCSSPSPGPLTDTWTWDGQDWTQRKPSASPSFLAVAHMAWDARSGRVLLVEARGYAVPAMYPANRSGVEPDMVLPGTGAGAVYAWQGATWVKVGPAAAEPVAPVLVAADPATGSVLMVGQAGLGFPCAALRATGGAGPAMMCPLGIDSSAAGPAAGATDGGVASSGGGTSSSGEGMSASGGSGALAPACPPLASPGAVVNCAVILAAPRADAPPTCPANAACAAPPTCPANAPCPTMPPTPGGPVPDCRAVHSCPVPPVMPSLISSTWSGRSWSTVSGAGGPQVLGAMATDPADNGVLGLAFDGGTWVWDGHRWALRHNAGGPSTRNGAALAEDARGHVVLVGGLAPGGFAGDTWTWDGSRWTRRGGTAPTLPPKPSAEPPSSMPVPAPTPAVSCSGQDVRLDVTTVPASSGQPSATTLAVQLIGTTRSCPAGAAVTLRLFDAGSGRMLAVQGNPLAFTLPPPGAGPLMALQKGPPTLTEGALVIWSNWCAAATSAVAVVTGGAGMGIKATVPLPSCSYRGQPSTLRADSPAGVPFATAPAP